MSRLIIFNASKDMIYTQEIEGNTQHVMRVFLLYLFIQPTSDSQCSSHCNFIPWRDKSALASDISYREIRRRVVARYDNG